MNRSKCVSGLILANLIGLAQVSLADETAAEKAEASKNKAVDTVRKTYRNVKDKTCNMIHGKLECAEKKIVNESKNLLDKVETKVKEEKNKAD